MSVIKLTFSLENGLWRVEKIHLTNDGNTFESVCGNISKDEAIECIEEAMTPNKVRR